MRALVVAAHPDDEILGCAATVARLTADGHEVALLVLGEGETSRSVEGSEAASTAHLRAACLDAAALLGVAPVRMSGLPDNRLDSVPLLTIVKEVESMIDEVRPKIVFTHHPGDLNVDHGLVSRAVLTATRPLPGVEVESLLYFEVLSATEWSFQRIRPAFRPTVFVDVTDTLDRKLEALQLYEVELRDFPHPRSIEAVRVSAERWGTVVGVAAAEAFELVRTTWSRGGSFL